MTIPRKRARRGRLAPVLALDFPLPARADKRLLSECLVSKAAPANPARLRVVSARDDAAREPSDEQLVDAVQRGDHQVAGVLYERLITVVDHTIYRVFGRREPDHEDLIQAAFEQIIVTLSRKSYARACSLRTWASTISSHVAFNALRSRRRERGVLDRQATLENQIVRAPVDIEIEASSRAELERVRTTLAEMRPKYAEAVFLHDVLGHELAEIAILTQVSVAAAQSRLVRGRRELHRRLDKVDEQGGRR
jgi:RNA polymerase sigma-70 factor (ECF subfamily)